MWVLKLKLSADDFLLGSLAVKYGVDLVGYPLSCVRKKKHLELTAAGLLIGDAKKKRALLRGASRHPDVLRLEHRDNFVIIVSRQPLHTEPVYDPALIRPRPAFISWHGYHIWEIASWTKEPLQKIAKFAMKHHSGEILRLRKEKLRSLSFTTPFPEVSEQQRRALELAVGHGYYEYPRRTELRELAKLMKVSYSTYHEHLRRAEAKLMPTYRS